MTQRKEVVSVDDDDDIWQHAADMAAQDYQMDLVMERAQREKSGESIERALRTPIVPIEGTFSYAMEAARLNRKRLAALAAWEATE
jgi:hypothetical protein